MSTKGIAEDELAGLSPEERAALEADDTDEGGADTTTDDAADDAGTETTAAETPTKEGDAAGDGDEDPADDPVDEKTAAAPAVDDKVEQPKAETPAAADDADLFVPLLPRMAVVAVDDYDGKVAALHAAEDAAAAKFEDGEMERAEYQREQRRIAREVSALDTARLKAEIATEHNQQAGLSEWRALGDAYVRKVAKEGVDYKAGKVQVDGQDVPLLDEFDRMVKMLGADPKYAEKPDVWFLKEADRIVRAMHGLAASPAGKPAPAKPAAKPPSRKPNAAIPHTLGDIPAASDTSTDGDDGEFAALSKMGGLELEAELARLTPAQQTRYLEKQ